MKLKGWTDILKTKDGELVQFLVGGIIAEIVIAVQDWMTDGYRIRDVLLKILLGRFSFHSLLVFLGFSFDILSAFFLCCLPPKETCYLLRCQVFVYFKHWFATCESRLSHGFRHRYRNRLNPTFTMAGHFFKHSTSTIRTTTPPNTEVWSMNGTNIEKSSISFGFSKMSARDKIRSTSFSRSENLQLRKWLEMYFLQLCKGTTWDMQVRSPPDN